MGITTKTRIGIDIKDKSIFFVVRNKNEENKKIYLIVAEIIEFFINTENLKSLTNIWLFLNLIIIRIFQIYTFNLTSNLYLTFTNFTKYITSKDIQIENINKNIFCLNSKENIKLKHNIYDTDLNDNFLSSETEFSSPESNDNSPEIKPIKSSIKLPNLSLSSNSDEDNYQIDFLDNDISEDELTQINYNYSNQNDIVSPTFEDKDTKKLKNNTLLYQL